MCFPEQRTSIKHNFNPQTGRINTIKAGILDSVANFTYAFDTLGNLTSRSDATQSLTETFQYDTRNRLTQATIGAVTQTTSYNSVGNILGKTQLGATTSNSYTYLLTGAGRTVTWTSFNKVASITDGADKVEYVYDAEQQRLKQTSSLGGVINNTVVYLNDPASGASSEKHSASGGTWQDSIFVEGERVILRTQSASPAATTFQYFVQDHQGSVAVVTDQAGAVLQRLAYDAWGRRTGRHPRCEWHHHRTIQPRLYRSRTYGQHRADQHERAHLRSGDRQVHITGLDHSKCVPVAGAEPVRLCLQKTGEIY